MGPVFVHADPCSGPGGRRLAGGAQRVPRVLRAYDERGHILGGRLVPADGDPESVARELLGEAAVVHVRAVVFGCFQFSVTGENAWSGGKRERYDAGAAAQGDPGRRPSPREHPRP